VCLQGSSECMSGFFDTCTEDWKLTGKGTRDEVPFSVYAELS